MIKAVIFDMDGVIANTQKTHSALEVQILKRYGVDISPKELEKRYAGVRVKQLFTEMLKDAPDKTYDVEALVIEKRKRMMELANIGVEPIPGSPPLIKTLHEANFKLAIGSASQENYVEKITTSLGLRKYFEALSTGDMVEKGKPNPDIFLLAAKKLSVKPENCLVIEDGVSGMIAAKKAGMKCIGLVEDKLEEYPTKNLVESLSEITIAFIKSLDD